MGKHAPSKGRASLRWLVVSCHGAVHTRRERRPCRAAWRSPAAPTAGPLQPGTPTRCGTGRAPYFGAAASLRRPAGAAAVARGCPAARRRASSAPARPERALTGGEPPLRDATDAGREIGQGCRGRREAAAQHLLFQKLGGTCSAAACSDCAQWRISSSSVRPASHAASHSSAEAGAAAPASALGCTCRLTVRDFFFTAMTLP